MTDNQELALALLLWRAWRSKMPAVAPRGTNLNTQIGNTLDVSDAAIHLAKKYGVRDEFLLFALPVITVQVVELEPWNTNESDTIIKKPKRPKKKSWHVPVGRKKNSETPKPPN